MINLVFEDNKNFLNCYDESEIIPGGAIRITTSPYVNQLFIMNVYTNSINRNDNSPDLEFGKEKFQIYFKNIEEKIEGKYIIPIGVNQSPREWMADYYDDRSSELSNFKNIFDKLPQKYIKDLRNGKAYLLIDNSLEGYHSDDIFDYLYSSSSSRLISPKNIIYVTGNLLIEERLKIWMSLNKGKTPIRVIPYAHFETDIGYKAWQYRKHDGCPIPSTSTHKQHKDALGLENIKLYNFLNKKPRYHRTWMFNSLYEWNLLDKGIISMNKSYSDDDVNIDFYTLESNKIKNINKLLPIYAYDDNTNDKDFSYYMYNFNQKACLDSWMSIISETHFEDKQGTIFLSEKTFKTIACQSPFMILGNKNSLKELHKMGYKTFHDIIDESYDELESIHRINAIIDEIRKWESNPKKQDHFEWLYPILEHNVEVMRFNSVFNPPAGFHKLYSLLNK
jgi:hypothetical protein